MQVKTNLCMLSACMLFIYSLEKEEDTGSEIANTDVMLSQLKNDFVT